MNTIARTTVVAFLISISTVFAAPPASAPTTAPAVAIFAPTPAIDISGKTDFAESAAINDDAATQLAGLCSLVEFNKLPKSDRHVYSFDPWPGEKDALGAKSYSFNFRLGTEGVTRQKVAFIPNGGGPGGVSGLARGVDATTKQASLRGFGNLDWGGTQTHVYKFDKPVIAFAVVLRSPADVDLKRFFWASNKDNGFPVSYTLADGTVINLGTRAERGAVLKAEQNNFLGVIDRSGTGIVSVQYTIKGLGGNKAQPIQMNQMAFVTAPRPAIASIINLKSSCDFNSPESIVSPTNSPAGLMSASEFRSIVGNHRYVYDFSTWPTNSPKLNSNSNEFSFDLKGKGETGQKVTIATNRAKLEQVTINTDDGESYPALSVGEVNSAGPAEHTFKFQKPVFAFGVTYRSTAESKLAGKISYTLSDGKVVELDPAGATLPANQRTFVGVKDQSDKGISAVTLRVQGASSAPIHIEDLAFAFAGPPPGNWKLVMADEFDGNELNPKYWSTGYRFVDVINNELQAYVPENVVVKDGICTIKAEKREAFNTDWKGKTKAKQQIASGAFTSAARFTQTYGYFEARIKMPKARARGVWPAFWMLPDRGPAHPDSSRWSYRTKQYGTGIEIDIFEFMPNWKRADGTFPVHVGCIWSYGKVTPEDPAPHGYGAYALDNDGWGPSELYFPKLDEEFHTYGLYWSPERLIFYVDSKPVFRVKDPKHVPDVPHYFLFNIAVHTNAWGRNPEKKNVPVEEIYADLPSAMEIDYFRAYSGVLEEAIPPTPSDIPGEPRKYPVPPKESAAPVVTPSSAPATQPNDPNAAPVNSTINSQSGG